MREKQLEQALKRMEMLNLSKQCINAFKNGNIWESEGIGALYECNDKEKEIIKSFENKTNGLVYHMIHNKFEFGECYTMLYVSQYEDEWEDDMEDIKNGYIFAYVENIDVPDYSEFGSVAIQSNIGGLVRIG